jgi:hypothetical protein
MGPQADQAPLAQRELTRKALDAVVAIACDSRVSPHARASIRELAFDAFEISAGKRFRLGSDGKGYSSGIWHSGFQVPTPLLPLALRHAQVSKYAGSTGEIGAAIAQRVGADSGGRDRFTSPDRFCSFEEIRHGMGSTMGRKLPFASDALVIEYRDFGPKLKLLTAAAIGKKIPQVAVLLHKNHWVAVVIGPSTTKGKVDVVVYDTLHEKGEQFARGIEGGIRQVSGDGLKDFTYVGLNVQRTTNGCGPLCVRALSELRSLVDRSGSSISMEVVARVLQENVAELARLDPSTLHDVVAGWRGTMLEGLSEVIPEQVAGSSLAPSDKPLKTRKVRRSRQMDTGKYLNQLGNSTSNFEVDRLGNPASTVSRTQSGVVNFHPAPKTLAAKRFLVRSSSAF